MGAKRAAATRLGPYTSRSTELPAAPARTSVEAVRVQPSLVNARGHAIAVQLYLVDPLWPGWRLLD
jgi:hypothetical protein